MGMPRCAQPPAQINVSVLRQMSAGRPSHCVQTIIRRQTAWPNGSFRQQRPARIFENTLPSVSRAGLPHTSTQVPPLFECAGYGTCYAMQGVVNLVSGTGGGKNSVLVSETTLVPKHSLRIRVILNDSSDCELPLG